MSTKKPADHDSPQRPFNQQPLDELLSQLVDADLPVQEQEQLLRLVMNSDRDIRRYVDHVILDTLLQEEIGPESLVELVDLPEDSLFGNDESAAFFAPQRLRTRGKMYAGFAVAAGLVFLMLAIFPGNDTAFANASTLVRAAIETHGQNVERVYTVEVTKADPVSPRIVRSARVATQGDRFWVEMNRGRQSWIWGRMDDGSVWLAIGPQQALVLSPDEVGEPLSHIADVYSLRPQELLRYVLSNYDLQYSQPEPLTHRIVAVPQHGHHRRLKRAVMDVDTETKAVRRLTIERQFADDHQSTQTFTLVDSRTSDESLFRPEGHLRGDAQILDRSSSPDRRLTILQDLFGSAAAGWLKSKN